VRRIITLLAAVLTLTATLVGFQAVVGAAAPASAATSGSAFQAGYIISDANFYNGSGMTAAQIQAFLTAQVGTCTSSSCLANGSFSLDSHAADAMCKAVTGGTALSTATIISRVSTACGIAPQVILTTLQKEQSLITAKSPSAGTLAAAMGYACPDTGNGCDPDYSGVGNQIYWSAWQWKRYGNPAGTSDYFTWLAPGATHQIQYDVPTSCGTKSVLVQNAATAALYYYTPYTPNAAALSNLYGTGDSCSAYGNRNFWRIYSDWFGSPTGSTATNVLGHVDSVKAGYQTLTVTGWAADSTTTSSTKVTVTVDGKTASTLTASGSRPDVAKAYPAIGKLHGFSSTIQVAAGSHDVCVLGYAANGTDSKSIACSTVTVASGSPVGSSDSIAAVPGGVAVRGWALDPETTSPIKVQVAIDGKTASTLTASVTRADVAKIYPASGAAHGYSSTLAVTPGTHSVCVTAINVGVGSNTPLGSCVTVRAPGDNPIGSLDKATTTPTSVTLSGWALDGDTTGSIHVDVYVDGAAHRLTANATRSDIAKLYPSYGAAHGYSVTYKLPAGKHTIRVYAINSGVGGNTTLWNSSVTIVDAAPIGSFDKATPAAGSTAVSGWAIDPDTTASINTIVQLDGVGHTVAATLTRSDVARVYPKFGSKHGFATTLAAKAGKHQVCVIGVDSAGGANKSFGCKTVVVP
jgi:hypothetical protein